MALDIGSSFSSNDFFKSLVGLEPASAILLIVALAAAIHSAIYGIATEMPFALAGAYPDVC